MLYPVKVFDKHGQLKRTITVKELKDNHWNNINKTRGFTSFGKSKPNELTAEYKKNKIQI